MDEAEGQAPPASSPKPEDWLLEFTSSNVMAPEGDGRPWGDGTAMAQRAYQKRAPWDGGSSVTPLIGGDVAMIAMRGAFEDAIMVAQELATHGVPPGKRGYVYIADWQFNALRDLSSSGNRWRPETLVERDQTALGLVLRMMSAGIVVRLLLWMPTTVQAFSMRALALEHWNVAAAVQDHDATLRETWGPSPERSYGVVALDLRTAAPVAASLHQKMIVVRAGELNAAFVGGVDLAFTRRDFGLREYLAVGYGDWQSGLEIPLASEGWPKQSPPPLGGYPRYPYCEGGQFPEDLPATVYGSYRRHWYDHHLELSGSAVAQVEQHFAERWVMECGTNVYLFRREERMTGRGGQVQLTSAEAIGPGPSVLPLPAGQPIRPQGKAIVQTWRTIPLRPGVSKGPFVRGEFTVMAGIAKAVSRATELITIWDQYFWSVPLAKLLAARLMAVSTLRLLIVLPPYGTTRSEEEMALRFVALQTLWNDLTESARSRVLVRNMWARDGNVGVYVHAKSQTYDEALLVCGSANMNRRSTQCDAELDCAVLEVETVRRHLANLYQGVTHTPWQSTYSSGWLARWWEGIRAHGEWALIPDPFFAATIGEPRTPNGVPILYRAYPFELGLFEPTSIGPPVETNVCGYSECKGDPRAVGRLDEISYLLERCHRGTTWPWRMPASFAAEDPPAEGIPRLTL